MAEVGDLAVGIGQPPVVEHLQEQVPHPRMRLLELVQQHHRERLLADALGQRVRTGRRAALAHDLADRLTGLELAHVQPDQPVGRTEQELRERLRQFGLAGAGGAGEEEDADRLGGVDQARLQHGDAVDHRADGLVLADHPLGEVGAHGGEVERGGVAEDVRRQAGHLRDRLDHLSDARPRSAWAASGPLRRALKHVGDHARRLAGLEVLQREAQRGLPRLDADLGLAPGLQRLGHGAGERREPGLVQRLQPHDLHHHPQRRSRLQHAATPSGSASASRISLPSATAGQA